jgi:hydrogenase maturation factor
MLNAGKLPSSLMNRLLKKYYPHKKGSRVVIGPQVGQDCAVIDIGEKYLISKTDPVTFATDEIGYYAVHINANDIATSGAKPLWFQATILLPEEKSDEKTCEKIMEDIAKECESLGIEVIGGHTEVTIGLNRPIVVGSMLGEVDKAQLITSMGGKPGDALILTKGIVLEGSSIIAREKEQELIDKGVSRDLIEKGKQYLHAPGISIVKEAQLVQEKFKVHAMHDPTEGGLAMGIVELASNSNCGVKMDYSKIPFIEGAKEFCAAFGLDPLRTIASGALLLAIAKEDASEAVTYLLNHDINAAIIGQLTDQVNEYTIENLEQKAIPLKYSEIDEITKIF